MRTATRRTATAPRFCDDPATDALLPGREGIMDFWDGLDEEILACCDVGTPITPAEIGRKVGLSETAAASCLVMLAIEGKVRICLVERVRVPPAHTPRAPAVSRR